MTVLSLLQREKNPGFFEGLARRLVDLDVTYQSMKHETEALFNDTSSGTLTKEEHDRRLRNFQRQKRIYDSYGRRLKILRYLFF